MRRFIVSVTFIFCSVLLQAAPLKVLSATPKGSLNDFGRQAISVSFNQPVVALGEQSALSSSDCPLHITPAVEGVCRYSGTQTLVFEPKQPWPVATAFTVKINRGFGSEVSGAKLAAPYTFSFTSIRPQVRQIYPQANEHWLSLTPTLYAGFNVLMNVANVGKHAYLITPSGEHIALSAREITGEEYEKHFFYLPSEKYALAFTPAQKLQPGTIYTFMLEQGLRGESGSLGLAKAHTSTFVTSPDLAVLGTVQTGCLPFVPQVRFSSPVRLRNLSEAATVTPATAKRTLSAEEQDALGREEVILPFDKLSASAKRHITSRYTLTEQEQKTGVAFFNTPLSFLELKPGQTVRVTLDKNLTDIYGSRLGKDYTFTVTNNGYCPAVDFSGGYGVLESYLPPRLPIELMNTPQLTVRTARFNKENYIPFLTASDNAYCAEKPLTDTTFSGMYTFKDIKDKTVKTYLDLARFSPTAQDSLIFSQLKITRNGEPCWVSSTDNLTDVGLTFKVSAENILLWATSLETGEPMANLTVELRDRTNTILWSGSTDMNGLARAPGWNQLDTQVPSWGAPKLYAFVSSAGGDGFISTELDDGLEPWRFNISYTYNPQQEAWRTFLFTERGIYRPGETVHVSAIVRHLKGGTLNVPTALTGKLVIRDGAGTDVFSQTVTTDDKWGTFEKSFEIPATAHTGDWDVIFTPQLKGESDPSSTYASFKVDSVKAAEFNVTMQAAKSNYISGEEARFTAAANYQSGAPLGQAPAKWTLRREMAWLELDGYDNYTFVPYFLRENEYKENGKQLAGATQTTDDKGVTSFAASLPEVAGPVRIFAEVGVQSPAKQDLFARKAVMLHPASFYLGAKPAEGYFREGSPVTARIVAVTPQGKRTQAPANVTAQIKRVEWHSVRKVGLAGRLEWVSNKEEIELPSQMLTVGEDGAEFYFVPPQSGTYNITLLTTDEQGRTVRGGFDVMVYGKDGPAWLQKDDDLLSLKQDKNDYRVGETARIHIKSPYDTAQALVSVEREGILDTWLTTVKGGADYIEVPIKENYLPNVFVSVTLVKGRTAAPITDKGVDLGKPQSKTGYVNLKVTPQTKKMTVEINTRKKEYRPGDEVTVKLSTKLGRKGVPAQVALFVVDEGVLALTDYKTPDPFDTFYGARPLSVFTSANRPYVIGQRNFGEKGESRGGGGSDFAKLGGIDLRSRFSFVPYFNARVQTDAKGRAEVKFKLPDNLTRFRIMAVAVRAQEFGSAQTQITVSKPLMVTASLPKIVRPGDKFSCRAVAYNYADKKGVLTVQAAAVGSVRLTDIAAKTITVPLGQAQEIAWPCEATQAGTAQVAFSVKAHGESDGVRADISVRPVEKPQTLATYNATAGVQEELLAKPENLLDSAKNQVTVSLASTALLNLQGALMYLTTYPYDCLEQQLSKISPVIESEKLVQDFHVGDVAAFKKQAQEVLNNLPAYQHPSGGFGYWKESLPDLYVTAYALQTAYRAKQAGFTVPQEALNRAADWLETAFAKNTTLAFTYALPEVQTARAQSLYALSLYGKNISAAFNNLYAQRGVLPLPAVAYLLKAAVVSQRTDYIKQTLAQQLLNHISYTPMHVYFTAKSPMPWLHLTDVSTTALTLEALLDAGQPIEQAPKAVSWLITQLNAQGHWQSTAENAAVLAALTTYEKKMENPVPDFTARVAFNGAPVKEATFRGRTLALETTQVPFSTAYASGNQARVNLAKTGTGTLYYTLAQTYTPRAYTTPLNAGFEVSRKVTTLEGNEVKQLKAGQRYYVTLTVRNASASHFVVAEDFVPAGVEIVNTTLATETSATDTLQSSAFGRTERYDDRIAAFADYLPAGTHTFTYMISAVTDGTFAYPSAWASLMYDPAVFGRNATSQLIIEK